jgi:hypothetical protein
LFSFREAGTQVSPVTVSRLSPRTAVPPYLPPGIKDLLKEDARLFALSVCYGVFCFGLLGFWLLDLGGFWKGELLKGKGFLKGNELLKGNC